MASLTAEEKGLFPLKTIPAVIRLLQSILTRTDQPDLSLISIIVGYIENTLCASPVVGSQNTYKLGASENEEDSVTVRVDADFPALQLHVMEGLHAKFRATVKSAVDVTQYNLVDGFASRDIVKRVSDVIWNTLMRSYHKDRAHIQNLYSYLTASKLDCYGVALAVIAGCQALGLDDVHLAISEDHIWAVFGPEGLETCEITWHGKGNEDKRGQPVDARVQANSWLYVGGKPVTGNRFTEVASIFASMNPAINSTTDNLEVATLQQQLLWILYDLGYLSKYPMALGNLADLEEQCPTDVPNRPQCDKLFLMAVEVSRRHFGDCHVYPYTYQAGYFYRSRMFKEALESWANAADVVRKYNYSREDEEIYKEFLEIANELIPHVIKVEGSGHNARSILKDPECFSHLLRFYDGICQWEEDSTTPILHIGWAKPLVNTISKFDAQVRRLVAIECVVSDKDGSDSALGAAVPVPTEGCRLTLKSQKMAGLKDLLLSEKLNTQAISLQLTAQSQVQLGGRKTRDDAKDGKPENKEQSKETPTSRSKRLRKE